jgi:protoporphyrinogen/coproporphyrinogen III oxidase
MKSLGQDVSVIGGGASGMFAAYALSKSGRRVKLYEASDRLGGVIGTTIGEYGLYEHAANSLISSPELEELCADLGVRLLPLENSQKYILRDGKARRIPLSFRAMIRALYGYYCVRETASNPCGEDMYSKMTFYLGDEVAVYMADAMATGIYGCSARELHMAFAMPQFNPALNQTLAQHFKARKKNGLSSKRVIVYPEGGMSVLMNRLADYLHECLKDNLFLNHHINEFHSTDEQVWTVPAYVLAQVFRHEALSSVRYSALKSFGIAFSPSAFPHGKDPKGLGCLIPCVEQKHLLGVLYSSSSFANRSLKDGAVIWTCMTTIDTDMDQLMKELRAIYGIKDNPLEYHEYPWPKAIPIYDKSLYEGLTNIQNALPNNIHLLSNYTGEVSLRGILKRAFDLSPPSWLVPRHPNPERSEGEVSS